MVNKFSYDGIPLYVVGRGGTSLNKEIGYYSYQKIK
jgi:hypothetical protein